MNRSVPWHVVFFQENVSELLREANLLGSVRHPNIGEHALLALPVRLSLSRQAPHVNSVYIWDPAARTGFGSLYTDWVHLLVVAWTLEPTRGLLARNIAIPCCASAIQPLAV